MFVFHLRDHVKDIYTSFEGIVTGRCEHATGESTYLVESIDTTGRPISEWYNEARLMGVDDEE